MRLRMWKLIQITPEKSTQHLWGDEGEGFWGVALIRNCCLYFNDIENGYNWSRFTVYGTIDEYWCNQDTIPQAILYIDCSAERSGAGPKLGPLEPLP